MLYNLLGGLEHFLFFHNIWDNPSHWLIFFWEGLKPPTSNPTYSKVATSTYHPIFILHSLPWSVAKCGAGTRTSSWRTKRSSSAMRFEQGRRRRWKKCWRRSLSLGENWENLGRNWRRNRPFYANALMNDVWFKVDEWLQRIWMDDWVLGWYKWNFWSQLDRLVLVEALWASY